MKILCVCRSGNVRSVATKYVLNKRGYDDVIAVGGYLNTFKTMSILCKWADTILLAKPNHRAFISSDYRDKIDKNFVIGDDRWGTPVNWELAEIIEKQLDTIEL